MKRFHLSIAVTDLQRSVNFYTTLFAAAPDVLKQDYAKWMLDDPRINFSLNASERSNGVSHVGLQMDNMRELAAIQERLLLAGQVTVEQPDAECCYSRSSKTWVRDPDNVAWEAFVTHGDTTQYGTDFVLEDSSAHSTESSDSPGCCKREADASGPTRCCV
jgi:catechol 2,3-dioxygenase-like lactoylglutathione lyase family enzyme